MWWATEHNLSSRLKCLAIVKALMGTCQRKAKECLQYNVISICAKSMFVIGNFHHAVLLFQISLSEEYKRTNANSIQSADIMIDIAKCWIEMKQFQRALDWLNKSQQIKLLYFQFEHSQIKAINELKQLCH